MDTKSILIIIFIFFILIRFLPRSFYDTYKYLYNPSQADKVVIKSSPPRYKSITQQLIPKRIIQTEASDMLELNIYHTCNQNKYMNSDYEYLFFDNQACDDFIRENYPEYLEDYHNIIPGAYKADLFRYLVLYKLGGVYIDCKSVVIEPLNNFISPEDSLVMVRDLVQTNIYNGIIASVPGHGVIKSYIDKYISNIRKKYYGKDPFNIGGPSMCGEVFREIIGTNSPIKLGKYNIDGTIVNITSFTDFSSTTSVIRRDDGKVLFSRSPSNYLSRKVVEIITLKGYDSRWLLGKVYK